MSNNPLTPEIIIETLKRSSLNTVLIEGKDDSIIYGYLQEEISEIDIDFLQCGGRNTLLEIYKKRNEIEMKLLFICDSDLWIFTGIPGFISDSLVTTEGYSIENELYQDGKQILDSLLKEDELQRKEEIIANLCSWFTHEVSLHIQDQQHDNDFSSVSILNRSLVENNSNNFKQEFLEERNYSSPDIDLLKDISDNYFHRLRGKYLFEVFEKLFQERARGEVKYRKSHLFDLVYRSAISKVEKDKILANRRNMILEYFG